MLLALSLLAATAASPSLPDPMTVRMAALFDEVCLKAFPDDAALDAAMLARKAKPLTPDEVKVTLRDDPGRGWAINSGGELITVFLELPPFHACSVRFAVPEKAYDISAYRAAAGAYEAANAGFIADQPYDADMGDIHIHAFNEHRTLPDRRSESLMLIDQHITDIVRRANGETGLSRRFVHQFAPPE